jgi:hypothetical protein
MCNRCKQKNGQIIEGGDLYINLEEEIARALIKGVSDSVSSFYAKHSATDETTLLAARASLTAAFQMSCVQLEAMLESHYQLRENFPECIRELIILYLPFIALEDKFLQLSQEEFIKQVFEIRRQIANNKVTFEISMHVNSETGH